MSRKIRFWITVSTITPFTVGSANALLQHSCQQYITTTSTATNTHRSRKLLYRDYFSDLRPYSRMELSSVPNSQLRDKKMTQMDRPFHNVEGEETTRITIQEQRKNHRIPKYHHYTVCMVPPESNVRVWEYITQCRTTLKDPGLYRWPPHSNLLYPFVNLYKQNAQPTEKDNPSTIDPAILEGLVKACRQCDPFTVRLQQFGTFGGRQRGVLWIDPDSSIPGEDSNNDIKETPLVRLQSLLVESFPNCNDQNVKSNTGYSPHITVSHFVNLQEAEMARLHVQPTWPTDLEFVVDVIYILERKGDDGQFLRVADVSLGKCSNVIVHPTPIAFRLMPNTEVDWVREERMKLKQRRNNKTT